MSRNIADTVCQFCGGEVKLVEEPRLLTEKDAGPYFSEFAGMLVANAQCTDCEGKYLAWVSEGKYPGRNTCSTDRLFYDLSFRSTFNDEHGPADVPTYTIKVVRMRCTIADIRKTEFWHAHWDKE